MIARTLQLLAEPLPAQGDLASTPFPVLLGRARAVQATGVLSVGGERFIFFLRGAPVHVESLDGEESSEVYLTSRLPAPVDDRTMFAARALARDSGRGLGEALLSLSALEPNELFEHKRTHAKQKLVRCFGLSGAIRFEARDGFGAEIVPLPLDVLEALRDGLGRFYDRARLDHELPIDDLCRVGVVPGPVPPGLTTDEARIVQRAASGPTVQAIASSGGLRSDEVRRHLYALYCLGLLRFAPSAPSPPPLPPDAVKARPVPPPTPPPAGPAPRRDPSGPVADRRDPTGPARRDPPGSTPERRDPSGSIPARRDPSGSTPARRDPSGSTPARREPSGSTPARRDATGSTPAKRDGTGPRPTRRDTTGSMKAQRGGGKVRPVEEVLEAAEIARAEGDLLAALSILQDADREQPAEPALQAQLAFLLVLVDPRRNAKEANRLAHEARKANPSLPLPYVVMGMLLEQIGQREQASQMYKHALSRDPECSDASRRLTLLERMRK